jgi:C2 domain
MCEVTRAIVMKQFKDALRGGGYIELSLSCNDLPRLDVGSKSDPFAVIYVREEEIWRRIGMTETVYDCHSVSWTQKFLFHVEKDLTTILKVDLYDRDSSKEDLQLHDYIGSSTGVRFADILDHPVKCISLPLLRKGSESGNGFLHMSVDAISIDILQSVTIRVTVVSPIRAKFFAQYSKLMPHGGYAPVFRSELLEKDENVFRPVHMKLSTLCAGYSNRPVMIELYQFYTFGRWKLLGFVQTTIDALDRLNNVDTIPWTETSRGCPMEVKVEKGEACDSDGGAKSYRFIIRSP